VFFSLSTFLCKAEKNCPLKRDHLRGTPQTQRSSKKRIVRLTRSLIILEPSDIYESRLIIKLISGAVAFPSLSSTFPSCPFYSLEYANISKPTQLYPTSPNPTLPWAPSVHIPYLTCLTLPSLTFYMQTYLEKHSKLSVLLAVVVAIVAGLVMTLYPHSRGVL